MSTLYVTIIVQAIGLLAVVCFIFSFQIKSNKALFLCQMAGSALFCVQYMLLGAFTGCLSYLAAIIRNIMLSNMQNEIFILSSIIISIFRYGWKAMGENKFEK